jgi:hypothetical protein
LTEERLELALKELDIALANRVFEIQSFWQRSNYFLVLLTALGAATFTIKDELLQLILSVLSALCALFWYRTNLGSKFWQESWEVEVNLLAEKIGIESFKRPLKAVTEQVRASLNPDASGKGWFRRYIDTQIIGKPSVTQNMIALSLFVFVVWLLISSILGYRSFATHCEWHCLYFTCRS